MNLMIKLKNQVVKWILNLKKHIVIKILIKTYKNKFLDINNNVNNKIKKFNF